MNDSTGAVEVGVWSCRRLSPSIYKPISWISSWSALKIEKSDYLEDKFKINSLMLKSFPEFSCIFVTFSVKVLTLALYHPVILYMFLLNEILHLFSSKSSVQNFLYKDTQKSLFSMKFFGRTSLLTGSICSPKTNTLQRKTSCSSFLPCAASRSRPMRSSKSCPTTRWTSEPCEQLRPSGRWASSWLRRRTWALTKPTRISRTRGSAKGTRSSSSSTRSVNCTLGPSLAGETEMETKVASWSCFEACLSNFPSLPRLRSASAPPPSVNDVLAIKPWTMDTNTKDFLVIHDEIFVSIDRFWLQLSE